MKEFWTSLASMMGVWAFCQSLLHTVLPPELRFAIAKLFNRLFNWCSSYCFYDITEIDGVNTNELYNAAQLYLSTSAASTTASSTGTSRLSLTRAVNSSAVTFGLANNDRLVDVFRGVPVLWEHVVTQRQSQTLSWRPLPDEKRGFTLRIRKREKCLILEPYLDHIMDKANEIRRKNQDRFLYTNSRGGSLDSRGHPWESVPFKHPSTFDTLAMDPKLKQQIMADLKDFANGQSFYQKTGRAWKRGYLLYGPPGTGKSSMIAAMANFLGYDIYDLELTEVHNNSELRKLLMKTSSKSIIVIEDIDCSINLTHRKKKIGGGGGGGGREQYDGPPPELRGGFPGADEGGNSITLSGLLNFTDGLWSCCGSERIFVFTTNHIEKLDPALLRSGRMDMHIFMSYCSFPSLKILLKNYLDYGDGDLAENVEKQLEDVIDKAEMTPADVSEVLIKNRRDRVKAVAELMEVLKGRSEKNRGKDGIRREEEEQEKRALDSVIDLNSDEIDDQLRSEICKKGAAGEEDDDESDKPN
ncbi:AAA-ATPase At5g57480-like [Impatiens glandulifera]|uniref:AAA-ATPase At5g57480-like n=1 Tax=Impatiens glandulifera TaxID=253017 RepID=UPI001FB0AC16|nr:AAA-ATPase At5g57480-like [Impatiens glandulifera]